MADSRLRNCMDAVEKVARRFDAMQGRRDRQDAYTYKEVVQKGFLAKETGFPTGGFYATDPDGNTLRGNAKYGEMPQRYKTYEQAETAARKELKRRKADDIEPLTAQEREAAFR